MFEAMHCINFASCEFDSFAEAKVVLLKMRQRNDCLIDRLAVGFWEEIPSENGVLRIFKICAECRKDSK